MIKKRFLFYTILLLVLFLLAIPKIWFNSNSQVQQKSKPMPTQVGLYKIQARPLEKSIVVAGELHAMNEVMLKSEANGRVTAVYFKEGSNVSKGQLLLQMNAQDLQAQLKKVQSQCKMKELTLNRAKLLLKEGGISEENFEQVETEYLSAQADVELIKEQIKKTQIFAPFSGTIGISSVDVGSYLTANSAIVALQQTHQLKLDFAIPEKYAALIKPNMEVSFATESSAKQFQAKIVAIEPAIDANTRNRNVRAIFQNNQQACVPGSFAKVFVNMALNKNAILVPTTCIVPILKGQKVYVAQGDSVVNRNVVVGERLDSMVEVVEGLYNGESVVYKGVIQLKPGSKIISK